MVNKIHSLNGTKVGCTSDIVQTRKNGFTFNYNDELALIDIFKTLSIDKLKIMGDTAEQNINKWNFKAIVEALEQAF